MSLLSPTKPHSEPMSTWTCSLWVLKLHFWHSNIKYQHRFAAEKRHIHPVPCFLPRSLILLMFKCFLTINLPCPMSDIHLLPYHNDLLTKSKIPFRKFGTPIETVLMSGKSDSEIGFSAHFWHSDCPTEYIKLWWRMDWDNYEKKCSLVKWKLSCPAGLFFCTWTRHKGNSFTVTCNWSSESHI